MNRRDFLKLGGITVATVALYPPILYDEIVQDEIVQSILPKVSGVLDTIRSDYLVDLVLSDGINEYTARLPVLDNKVDLSTEIMEFKLRLSNVEQPFGFCRVVVKDQDEVILDKETDMVFLYQGDSLEVMITLDWRETYEPA